MKIDDKILNEFFIIFIIFIVISLVANTLILLVYVRTKKYLKPINFASITLTIVNLVTIVFYLTHYTFGLYLGRVPFGLSGCIYQGFFVFFTGVCGVWILALLSSIRYALVYHPICMSNLRKNKTIIILICYFTINFLWSMMPIFGWSHYTIEHNDLQCDIDYRTRSFSALSFNALTLIFFWLIPISIGCYINFKILLIVRF